MTTAKCYCPDCPGSWAEKDPVDGSRFIRLCGCPCHEEHEEEDGAGEWIDDADYSEPFGPGSDEEADESQEQR